MHPTVWVSVSVHISASQSGGPRLAGAQEDGGLGVLVPTGLGPPHRCYSFPPPCENCGRDNLRRTRGLPPEAGSLACCWRAQHFDERISLGRWRICCPH